MVKIELINIVPTLTTSYAIQRVHNCEHGACKQTMLPVGHLVYVEVPIESLCVRERLKMSLGLVHLRPAGHTINTARIIPTASVVKCAAAGTLGFISPGDRGARRLMAGAERLRRVRS